MKTKFTFVGSLFFLLSLAILLTIYLAWLIYPLEISWLNLTSRVHVQPQTIQHNFNVLMDYLTNPLSQVLAMPDFPSSASGIHHFVVVKGLFHLAQGVAIVTLPIFYLFWKQVIQKGFLSLYRRGLLIMLSLPLVLGLVGVFIGFEQFFTLFHQILFVGKLSQRTKIKDACNRQSEALCFFLKFRLCLVDYKFGQFAVFHLHF